MTSFDTLSDEMALKIIKMAATPKSQSQTLITMAANKKLGDGEMLVKRWEDKVLRLLEDDTEEVGSWSLKYDHDFLVDVLSKVSLRFRRVARDSSLWKDYVRIYNPLNDISKLNFVIRECLNYGTKTLTVIWEYPISDPSVTLRYPRYLPNQYLTDLATMFPSLKRVNLFHFEEDIPAPWIVKGDNSASAFKMLTRD